MLVSYFFVSGDTFTNREMVQLIEVSSKKLYLVDTFEFWDIDIEDFQKISSRYSN